MFCSFSDGKIRNIMRIYDLVVVFRPSVTETARKKLLDTVKGWIKDTKITKEETWGLKALSYRIKKETSGFFSILHLEADKIPMDFEKRILEQENIIRHLLIRRK